ncbi:MAG: hypothetical protein FP814_11665, partial [Desulfobacterium sp.]|nr:hypothetical protein [Desulfobacterium sp.]
MPPSSFPKFLEVCTFFSSFSNSHNIFYTTRSLNLTLQLIKRKIPLILALNFWDETKHTGVDIDIEKLEKLLKVPCVPTVAVTGEGIKKMVDRIKEAKTSDLDYEEKEKWHKIGDIVQEVQKLSRRHHTFSEKFGDISISPFGGIP